ncbi:MAG TPA: hypothetical protein VF807_09925 [Ktedonobacterales bacterium]
MSYLTLAAKLEAYEESSYTLQSTGELRSRIQLTLTIPNMRDRVLCEFDLEHAPSSELLDRWELEESWLIVSANSFRALGFTRKNPRPNEKSVGALVVFQGTEVHEASIEERKQLQEAKKAARLQAKQRRVARQAA